MRNAGLLPAATLLHAFQYQESAQMFTDVLQRDPKCAIADFDLRARRRPAGTE